MILKRFYDEKLAAASYMVGCSMTGEALVVDPVRDVEQYVNAARTEGLKITHVTETHIHADFASGLRELVARTGARAYLSDEGGAEWRYAFADEIGAVLLKDGDELKVGNVRVQAMHTPGHTPEHMSFVVTDTAGADEPMGVFTGDFVFVGDVGRPDLLEKAAGATGTMAAGAQQLFRSLQKFRALPDWLQLWPGHGAGSACGKALGAVPTTTLGYEKRFNWAFSIDEENAFVDTVLAGQPEPPKYFAQMKQMNRAGPRVLGGLPQPERMAPSQLQDLLQGSAMVIDIRPWQDYRQGHVPGTINIPLNKSFTTWAGWLLPYDADFYLIGDAAGVAAAVRDLALIGLDRVAGWFDVGVVAPLATAKLEEIDAAQLRAMQQQGDVAILDVRNRSEHEAGHLADVPNVPLGYLLERIDEVPPGEPLVLHCKGGGRSAIATSLLAARGITNVVNLRGGYDGWVAAGNPVARDAAAATV